MNNEPKPILPEGAGPLGPHAYDAPRPNVEPGTFQPPYPEGTFKPEAPEAPYEYKDRNAEREVQASERMLGRIATGMPNAASAWLKSQERGETTDVKTGQPVPLYADEYGKPTTVQPGVPALYYEQQVAPTAGFGPRGSVMEQSNLPKAAETAKVRGDVIDSIPEVDPADAVIVKGPSAGNKAARLAPEKNAWQVGRPNHLKPDPRNLR